MQFLYPKIPKNNSQGQQVNKTKHF